MIGGSSIAGASLGGRMVNRRVRPFEAAGVEGRAAAPTIRTYLALGTSGAEGQGLGVTPMYITLLGAASAEGQAISSALDASGTASVTLGMNEATARALGLTPKTMLLLGVTNATAQAFSWGTKYGVGLPVAATDAQAIDAALSASGTAGASAEIAEALAKALPPDIDYLVRGVPDVNVEYTKGATTATVEVLNKGNSDIRIYRGKGRTANLSVLTTTSTNPFGDSGLDPADIYRYKVSFVVTGTKGGSPHVAESRRSDLKTTIGNKN